MNVVNKLLKAYCEDTTLHKDEWTIEKQLVADMRKWIANIVPVDLLKRSLKDSINSLVTLSQDGVLYSKFPERINS